MTSSTSSSLRRVIGVSSDIIRKQHQQLKRTQELDDLKRQAANVLKKENDDSFGDTMKLSRLSSKALLQHPNHFPQLIQMFPSHNMSTAQKGFTVTLPDGTKRGILSQQIGSRKKNEDFITGFTIRGSSDFLKEFREFLEEKIIPQMQEQTLDINQKDKNNEGGFEAGFIRIDKNSVQCGNIGDSPAGVLSPPLKTDDIPDNISEDEEKDYYPCFTELTERHAKQHPAGQQDIQDTYLQINPPFIVDKKKKNGNIDSYIYNPHNNRGLNTTRSFGDYKSRLEGFNQEAQKRIKEQATKLAFHTAPLKEDCFPCMYSDGTDLNYDIAHYNKPLMGLDSTFQELQNSDAESLTKSIQHQNKEQQINPDDQLFLGLGRPDENEIHIVFYGDGHGGSSRLTQKAVEFFSEKVKKEFKAQYPHGFIVNPFEENKPSPPQEAERQTLTFFDDIGL